MPTAIYNDTWMQWTTASTTASATWNQWITAGTSTTVTMTGQNVVWHNWQEAPGRRRETNDELQALRERQSRERLAREQQRRADREAAKARATELLHDLLTEAEQATLRESARVEIEGTDGNLYRLETHRETVHGNIVRVDEHGCILGRACVAPRMYDDGGALPTADGWVGQYLGLKFDTQEFLSHANWSGVRACQMAPNLRVAA